MGDDRDSNDSKMSADLILLDCVLGPSTSTCTLVSDEYVLHVGTVLDMHAHHARPVMVRNPRSDSTSKSFSC